MLASNDALERAVHDRVTYAAVGSTSHPQLLRFPPEGYTPFERRVRIGHGDRRWGFAVDELMTWRVKTRAGFGIVRRFPEDDDAELGQWRREQLYSSDGERYAVPGETAILNFAKLPIREPVRVVSLIEEDARRGLVYGTLPGHPLEGEEQLVVERAEDGSVWFVVRSFARPATTAWTIMSPVLTIVRRLVINRYAAVLSRAF